MKLTDDEIKLLRALVDHFDQEDKEVREQQIQLWKRLKYFWDGFVNIWWSTTAHDWRVWKQDETEDDQAYYDKSINIFRAYLESIIAALSVTIPGIKCIPDDADNALDIQTAKASDKIAELIAKHNDAELLWLQGLFIYCTEGLVACYNYTKEDKAYGTVKENIYEEEHEEVPVTVCPNCNAPVESDSTYCEECESEFPEPLIKTEIVTNTKLIGVTENPKSRQCMEVYGGLYVKVPNYAKKQEDCLYLTFSYETHYASARSRYPDIREKIHGSQGSGLDYYERWGRLSTQYQDDQPSNNVTCRLNWFRPEAFEALAADDCDKLKKKFPNGVRVDFVDETFAEAVEEKLDEHWTLTKNPLSDYIHHNPLGLLVTSTQEITTELVSLITQTIEHGIPQTFADPGVLNFNAYRQTEVAPGSIFPANPKSGRGMGDAFYEVRTATLSQEVLPFFQTIQSMGQVALGALPSLFGGQQEGSKTASEYGMSRAQALQRLQNIWKVFNTWWKGIFGKVVPAYIKEMQEDERFVKQNVFGSFVNVFIRTAELQGKIGDIELTSSENLPMTWMQQREAFMKVFELNNPQIIQFLMSPENLPKFSEFLGIRDIYIPGEDDRNKQFAEIALLLESEPIVIQPTEEDQFNAASQGQPPLEEEELPSIEIDPVIDNHQIEFEICRRWLVSDAGLLAKEEKPEGYRNVLLHAYAHYNRLMEAMMSQQQQANTTPQKSVSEKPKESSNVQTT